MKKILVSGSSGYIGNYLIKRLATAHPEIKVVGMSRSGKAREESTKALKNVEFVQGNCLLPETFEDQLKDVDGIIHTVGTLIEKKNNPDLTYQAMNKDACINMAAILQDYAQKEGNKRTFVYISSEKAPPFLEEYLTSKKEAENFLLSEDCQNLKPCILRPGFVWDKDQRWWSVPLKTFVDIGYQLNESVYKKAPFSKQIDFLFPAKSVKLSTLGHFAIEGALGNLEDKIISNDQLSKYEDLHK